MAYVPPAAPPPGQQLAFTGGSHLGTAALGAAGLVGAGATVLIVTRKRKAA